MIEFVKAYKLSGGQMAHDLKTAQVMELCTLLKLDGSKLAELIVEKKEAVIDILTTTKDSRPRARRVNGGKRTRKPATSTPAAPAPIMDEEDAIAASRTPGAIADGED